MDAKTGAGRPDERLAPGARPKRHGAREAGASRGCSQGGLPDRTAGVRRPQPSLRGARGVASGDFLSRRPREQTLGGRPLGRRWAEQRPPRRTRQGSALGRGGGAEARQARGWRQLLPHTTGLRASARKGVRLRWETQPGS